MSHSNAPPAVDAAGAAAARRTVIVTRPSDQAGPWVEALGRRGIAAVAVPLIGIAPTDDPAAVEAAWARLADHALLVFVSPNAATQFFAHRPEGMPWPVSVWAASPGPGTGSALRALGVPAERLIEPAADAAQFDSESLWARLRQQPWQGARVLIVRGEGGRGWLADKLAEAGARVDFLSAYRRAAAVLTPSDRLALQQALAQPDAHLWFFSSSEAVDHLLEASLLSPADLQTALASASAVATHPRIAERAQAAGFATATTCRPSLEAVVACIQSQRPLVPTGALRPAAP